VPGFVKGLEHAHAGYGSGHRGLTCCSWSDLIWKAIHEGLKGLKISEHFINSTQTKISQAELQSSEALLLKDLIGSSQSHEDKYFSDIPIYNKLIQTLKKIASNGSDALYSDNGQLAHDLVQDLGGAITLDDLKSYQVLETRPNIAMIGSHEVMVSPAPSSGPELLAFLNTLEYLNKTTSDFGSVNRENLHSMTQVLETLHELQLTLGDPSNPMVEKRTQYMLDKQNVARYNM
jgi:gamma-glutamyltranspeptidase/glutathione hydrolase